MSVLVQTNVKDPELVRERRRQIVQAAVTLFTEKGFHKATTRQIAQASGLSIGALYEYVQSKEDVLFLVCQHIHHEMESQLRGSLSQHRRAADRLREAILSFLRVIDAMQPDVLLIYQESKSLPEPYLHEVLRDEQAIAAIFQQLLEEGQQDGSLHVHRDAVELLAHDIVVAGEMWAFRRWALRGVDFATFAQRQLEMLMQACGAGDTKTRRDLP